MDINFKEMNKDLLSESSGGSTRGLYQDIVEDSVLCKGQRPIMDRINLIEFPKDSVLDIGCNVGSICHYYDYKGVKLVYGIDKNVTFIKWASKMTPNGEFLCIDLDKFDVTILGGKKFDTVLFLAVWDYFENKTRIVEFLKACVGRVLYFEGHADGKERIDKDIVDKGITYKSWKSILEEEIGINYKFIGMTEKNKRPFFKCWW